MYTIKEAIVKPTISSPLNNATKKLKTAPNIVVNTISLLLFNAETIHIPINPEAKRQLHPIKFPWSATGECIATSI